MTVEDRLRAAAAKYDDGNGEADQLVRDALARVAWRKRNGFKECAGCHMKLSVNAFGKDSRERDGLMRVCRVCVRHRDARRRAS